MNLQKGVMGGVAYFITPVALTENRLNLDPWFGYQEVLYRESLNPQEIDFDLLLPEGSCFSFIYNKTPHQFSGFRLSRDPFYPNLYFVAEDEGRFLKKESFETVNFKEINQVKILFEKNQIFLYLNGKLLKSVQENLASSFGMGFRGGVKPVSIDRVRIRLKKSDFILQEDFQNKSAFLFSFLMSLGIILGINLLLYFKQNKEIFYSLLTLNGVVLVGSVIFYIAFFSYLSQNYYFEKYYFKTVSFLRQYKSTIETKKKIIDRLRKTYPLEISSNAYPVLFVGTSQTWGAGATLEKDSFVHRLEEKFNQENHGGIHYEFINAGISGETAARLWEPYQKEWIQWNPKIVILNLSNNDQNSSEFSKYIEAYVKLNQEKGIPTVLILEANARAQIKPHVGKNHQILRDLAKRHDLVLIDLHQCLLEHDDSGFLWWDFVHPTSYGHELEADCIYPTLVEVIRKQNSSKENPF